ncbi:Ig-like domain-containing protein [Candidatus Galacturonibacter soehngenii]|uniref:BIG2 domain-containing protein n=1 Tax=Candidatus Galacturonatibacter soehngenii TaxID=2307010 RepID=A0A7V7UDR1_9FIRM|nr:Ig-like domain-containing protein [Candidatus Galacturonibacter soehngenii]KAB1440987.1 hypothetical protein F7O84_00440 [Candidatus Galacturonibacter soehngenii]MBA4689137.1 Ig-like domain-containing protein [Candidatus Galacturonibacter soehngenii]
MRLLKKSTILTILTLAFVLVATIFSTNTAVAATKPYLNSSKGTVFLYTEDTLTVKSIPGGLQRISWDSSNKSVLKVKSNAKTGVECTLIPKKTGTSTVTCTVETLTKTYKLTCEIKVKKASPFSKIYIDGKNNYKSKTSFITYNTEKSSIKVSSKVKKGWSLVAKEYQVYNTATSAKDVKKIPSNGKVPIGKYQTKVYFTARNKDNEFFVYTVVLKKTTSEKAKPKFAKKSDTIFLNTKNNEVQVKNFPSGATAVWTSSNKAVATVKKSSSEEGIGLLTPKKKGKTTITCIVTKKDKTVKKISYTLNVKGKVKPLEAVEIDGDNIVNDTKNNYFKFSTTDHSVLVQSYENRGWTITSETYTVYKTPKSFGTEQKITGIGTVQVGNYKTVVTVKLKNSSGATYTFTLDIFNSNYKK